ncbi:MAG TPA: hypothetical protein VFX68_02350 [Sulfuricurvum sp.]|nr:hypothetical protein [Sulfuricurvum sp.]
MNPFTLLLALVGLIFALILLVFLYVWMDRGEKNGTHGADNDPETFETFESLEAIIYHRASTNKALNSAADTILRRFGTIDDYFRYEELIKRLCVHPNTDSRLVSRFEKRLRDGNPKFKEKIQKALKEGLMKRDEK